MDKRFTLTADHITLLRAMWILWDDCEFGAPAVDSKRPYGNSGVTDDMRELLPHRASESDEALTELHTSTQTALQIILATGSFEPGNYECERYGNKWKKVGDPK